MRRDCLIAHFYPGFGPSFLCWPDLVKEALVANIDYVIAETNLRRMQLEPTTPEKAKAAALARTGDAEYAEEVRKHVAIQQKMQSLNNG